MSFLKVKAKMVELGMNQSQLASAIGIGPSTLSQKLNNDRRMTISEARKIQNILKITDEEFCKYFF